MHVESRAGDVKHSLADIKMAVDLLDYSPEVGVEDGLILQLDHSTEAIEMIVDVDGSENLLYFNFHVEESDLVKPSEKFQMGERRCVFHLPRNITKKQIHPDH